jgi:type VI secretion system protein ImpF
MARPAKPSSDAPVTLSVVDRLMDDEPDTSVEAALTRSETLRIHRRAVRRDLETLLNTRQIGDRPDESLKEVNQSVYMFGLRDFSGIGLESPKDQAQLLRSLQTAIRQSEPRLKNVQVIPLKSDVRATRALRFRIEGLLAIDPVPERVSFDTVLELTSSEYSVKGDTDA